MNLVSHLTKLPRRNALWNAKTAIWILRNNNTKHLEQMNYVPQH